MATKSFSESINEVMNSKSTRNEKIQALKAIGLTDYEIVLLTRTKRNGASATERIKLTFGVEIETLGMVRSEVLALARQNGLNLEYMGYTHQDSKTLYKLVTDSSINDASGLECVTPVLENTKRGFDGLHLLCDTINAAGARVNRSTGLHVHVGCKQMTDQQYCNVFVNYMYLEHIIDTFMAASRRGNNSCWCRTLQDHKVALLASGTPSQIDAALHHDRYHRVNSQSWLRHKTIEFRQHQGSTDFEKISKWVTFCTKLVAWSRDNRLDSDVASIDEIPFLTATEKRFFKGRAAALRG